MKRPILKEGWGGVYASRKSWGGIGVRRSTDTV